MKRNQVSSGIKLAVVVLVCLLAGCGGGGATRNDRISPEAARNEMKLRSIDFTEREFVRRVASNDARAAGLFIAAGMKTDARNADGETPLTIAAEQNYTRIIDLLLAGGADPNVGDATGATPLMHATRKASLDAMTKLLDRGANPNATDRDGSTPFMYSALNNDIRTASTLR